MLYSRGGVNNMWIVRWSVSGFVTKKMFDTEKEAKKYYNRTMETFGNDYYIKIDMYKGE